MIDFLPGGSRVLIIRRAEGIAYDDGDELASHEVGADDPAGLFGLGEPADRDNDEFAGACLIDGAQSWSPAGSICRGGRCRCVTDCATR
ncbi:hypothetical protein [Streptomyces sp. NPDC000880]